MCLKNSRLQYVRLARKRSESTWYSIIALSACSAPQVMASSSGACVSPVDGSDRRSAPERCWFMLISSALGLATERTFYQLK